jgi:hypothetical protein
MSRTRQRANAQGELQSARTRMRPHDHRAYSVNARPIKPISGKCAHANKNKTNMCSLETPAADRAPRPKYSMVNVGCDEGRIMPPSVGHLAMRSPATEKRYPAAPQIMQTNVKIR